MSRVLLDENISVGLRALLPTHDVITAQYQGWKGLTNGRLLAEAEAARFDVFVIADQNLRFQQRVFEKDFAVIVLSSTNWADIKAAVETTKLAIDRAAGGCISVLSIPRSGQARDAAP